MIPISSYSPAFSEKRQQMVPGCVPSPADLETEIERFRNGYYSAIVNECRSQSEETIQQFKAEKMPCITVSCVTKQWRNSDNVVSHSGFICFDIDGKMHPHVNNWGEIRDAIFKQPFVFASFLSASGQGVAFICRIVPAHHKDVFEYTEFEMLKHNIVIDPSGKDVVRLRFVTHDPDLKKRSIGETEYLMPSEEFINARDTHKVVPRPTSNVDSLQVFQQAMEWASLKREFKHGERHWYLMRVAIFCNASGMDEAYCKSTAVKIFTPQSDLTPAEITKPVSNVYRCYKSRFGVYPPPKPLYRAKDLRWLLKYASKSALKEKIHLYGRPTIPGNESYTIGVSSKNLCFLMAVACPQYSWTVTEFNDEYYGNQKCKELFDGGKYVDLCNGSPVLCTTNDYPSNWDK
jgi:hypothetical protein